MKEAQAEVSKCPGTPAFVAFVVAVGTGQIEESDLVVPSSATEPAAPETMQLSVDPFVVA